MAEASFYVLFLIAHSPDNTFLGFVVNVAPPMKPTKKTRRKAKALVYGKHFNMWKVRDSFGMGGGRDRWREGWVEGGIDGGRDGWREG